MPTFRLNAPVVIRAKVKEVRTNITIGPRQRTGIVAEGGTAHPDDTLGGALQPGWRTGSPWLLDRCDEEAGREEQSSPTFDLR